MLDEKLQLKLQEIVASNGRVTVLTGAGISAESGIPTFRGEEGYWSVGSQNYHPQEMATRQMFLQMPDEVWRWYLYRRGVCRRAKPNAGHIALVELEQKLADRFALITQNVDGLHLRAGNSPERTFQIHGNINFMRCADDCTPEVFAIPPHIIAKNKNTPLSDETKGVLRCLNCGGRARPHVLWFDEYYDEAHYKFNSSHQVAAQTDLLIVAGTSGNTNLPNQVAQSVVYQGGTIVDVNVSPNPFTDMALASGGFFVCAQSGSALPEMVSFF